MVGWGVWLNVLLAFFNLIPIPPLDGSHLLYHALPPRVAAKYREFGRYGVVVLLLIVVVAREALYVLLAPAFALQMVACQIMDPHVLTAIPICDL
jgi:Zn-dependent protease